jgi:hypothetical protein
MSVEIPESVPILDTSSPSDAMSDRFSSGRNMQSASLTWRDTSCGNVNAIPQRAHLQEVKGIGGKAILQRVHLRELQEKMLK